MFRKLVLLTLLLLSLSSFARTRVMGLRPAASDGGTVSGTVEHVDGTLIRLADGLVVIDAVNAKILVGRGREGTMADIEPGMLLFAAISTNGTPPANAALRASTITALQLGDATLMGTVTSIDAAARTFVLLGKTIFVDDDTSFGGFRHGDTSEFSDLLPNTVVNVQADAVNGRLVAREVLVLAPLPTRIERLRGTVKSIGTDAWTVDVDGTIETIGVDARTKIVGSPKVGDTVEVLYKVDSANAKVAVSIIRVDRIPSPPAGIEQFRGRVKSIEGGTWTVTVDTADRTFLVNDRTKVTSNTGVGDFVQVLAIRADGGTLTAIVVMKLGM